MINTNYNKEFLKNVIQRAESFDTAMVLVSNPNYNKKTKYSSYELLIAAGIESSVTSQQNSDFFEDLKSFSDKNNDWIFGHFGYDLKNYIEKLTSKNPDIIKFPDGFFFVPENIILYQDGKEKILKQTNHKKEFYRESYNNIPENNFSMKSKLEKCITHDKYIYIVNQLKKHIQRGDIFEINFCYEYFLKEIKIDPVDVFVTINEISPMPFAGFYKHADKYLLCFSPERFIKKIGTKVISQPMKGTIKRGTTKTEDEELKKYLSENIKEKTENIMITDLVRNDLSHTAKDGSVKVEKLCEIFGFKQVNQMVSTISSEIDNDIHPIDIIKYAFPMGSMTGAPKVRVMELIEKFEETKRGLYSGSIGYINPDKNFDFNVVIRSICYNKIQKYLNFMVGSAITSLSDPEMEYEECQLKAKALFDWLVTNDH